MRARIIEIPISEKDFRSEDYGRYLSYMLDKGNSNIQRVHGIDLPNEARLYRLMNSKGLPFSSILEKDDESGIPYEYSAPRADEHSLVARFRSACAEKAADSQAEAEDAA